MDDEEYCIELARAIVGGMFRGDDWSDYLIAAMINVATDKNAGITVFVAQQLYAEEMGWM